MFTRGWSFKEMVKHQIVSQELFIRQNKSGKPWGGAKRMRKKNPLVEVIEVSNMASEESVNCHVFHCTVKTLYTSYKW